MVLQGVDRGPEGSGRAVEALAPRGRHRVGAGRVVLHGEAGDARVHSQWDLGREFATVLGCETYSRDARCSIVPKATGKENGSQERRGLHKGLPILLAGFYLFSSQAFTHLAIPPIIVYQHEQGA